MNNNNIAELIDNLSYYNAWRRGEHDDMPAPEDVGMWLDAACDELEKLQGERDDLRQALSMVQGQLDSFRGIQCYGISNELSKLMHKLSTKIELILKP